MAIQSIMARSILDSQGNPTIETTVTTDTAAGTAAVPAGTSTGSHEAKELRDGDRRWDGLGVAKAVSHVNAEIAGILKGRDVIDQSGLDEAMRGLDGTEDKSRLGANAILSVSLAAVRAAAAAKGQPLWRYLGQRVRKTKPNRLPVPFCNVINGGQHADNTLVIQEFMIVPHGLPTFSEALRAATETFHALRTVLKNRGAGTGVGAEGGYAPDLESHTAALDTLVAAIKEAGYEPGRQISLALDVAAGTFYQEGSYVFEQQPLTAEQLVAQFASLLEQYPIVSLEDPLAEDDWDGWQVLYKRLGSQIMIIGDDLTVTDPARIGNAIDAKVIGGAIIKPNQIGTLSETIAAWKELSDHKLLPIISHRSGETNDTTIADLAVALGAPAIKAGAPSRGERVAKYNRLLAIETELGGNATYPGSTILKQRGKHATA